MFFEFFNIVIELKKIPRKGWKKKLNIEKPESVADHSFMTAVIAMVISDWKSLDTGKILKMTILHDIAESITGDLTPDEISKESKKSIENQSMDEILSKLPFNLLNDYSKLWREYQEAKTNEAILVHEMDRLEMALQARKYRLEGFSKNELEPFFTSAKKGIKDNELLKVLEEISYK